MKRTYYILLLVFLTSIGCNEPDEDEDDFISDVGPSFSAVEAPVISLSSINPSPSKDPSMYFTIRHADGDGFNGGVKFNIYYGSNCNSFMDSVDNGSYSLGVNVTLTFKEPGDHNISVNYTTLFGSNSQCSNAISFTALMPDPPTSVSLLNGVSSTDAEPHPRVSVSGSSPYKYKLYYDSACTQAASEATQSTWSTILGPLFNNSFEFYATSVTESGRESSCSAKLLDYTSTFTPQMTFTKASGVDAYRLENIDLDSDSNMDLVWYDLDGVHVQYGDGAGNYSDSIVYSADTVKTLDVGDITSDGIIDILIGTESKKLIVLEQDNARAFTSSNLIDHSSLGYHPTDFLEFIDLDSDGVEDILFKTDYVDILRIAKGNGDGTYQSVSDAHAETPYLHIVDINNDGDQDLLVADGDNWTTLGDRFKLYMNDGSGGFLPAITLNKSFRSYHAAFKDMNGDNQLDIIHASSSQVEILFMNGDQTSTSDQLITRKNGNATVMNLEVEDINGDTYNDIVLNSSGLSGKIHVIEGTNTSNFKDDYYHMNESSKFMKVFDYNGDGKLDIVSKSILTQD